MTMQDYSISHWGAQDKFQAHFIVKINADYPAKYVAKTILKTEGHFGAKQVSSVSWDGDALAKSLNSDDSLNEMIAKQSVRDATIFVEPSEGGVRIYSKWRTENDFQITKEMYAIYNTIAAHVRKI